MDLRYLNACREFFDEWRDHLGALLEGEGDELCSFLESFSSAQRVKEVQQGNLFEIICHLDDTAREIAPRFPESLPLQVLAPLLCATRCQSNWPKSCRDIFRLCKSGVNAPTKLQRKLAGVALEMLCSIAERSISVKAFAELIDLAVYTVNYLDEQVLCNLVESLCQLDDSRLCVFEPLISALSTSKRCALLLASHCTVQLLNLARRSGLATLLTTILVSFPNYYHCTEWNRLAFSLFPVLKVPIKNLDCVLRSSLSRARVIKTNCYGLLPCSLDQRLIVEEVALRLNYDFALVWVELASRLVAQDPLETENLFKIMQKFEFSSTSVDAFRCALHGLAVPIPLTGLSWLSLRQHFAALFAEELGPDQYFLSHSESSNAFAETFETWLNGDTVGPSFTMDLKTWLLLVKACWNSVGPSKFLRWLQRSASYTATLPTLFDCTGLLNYLLLLTVEGQLKDGDQATWECLVRECVLNRCNLAITALVGGVSFRNASDALAILAVSNMVYRADPRYPVNRVCLKAFAAELPNTLVNKLGPVLPLTSALLNSFKSDEDGKVQLLAWDDSLKVDAKLFESFQRLVTLYSPFNSPTAVDGCSADKTSGQGHSFSLHDKPNESLRPSTEMSEGDLNTEAIEDELQSISDLLYDQLGFSLVESRVIAPPSAADGPHFILDKLAATQEGFAVDAGHPNGGIASRTSPEILEKELDEALALFDIKFKAGNDFRKQRLLKAIALKS